MPGNILEAMMLSKGVSLEDRGKVFEGRAFEADINVKEIYLTNKLNSF